ncbi:TolC family outer membrane protein [Aquamicrobium sp. LC103]|uniref:TolC family outer membrane protein n=1 Tax=Aquamicrobium sp. LC103 TaxID=1120658 RepID=UPI00069B4540|nr:TolC family outer membrane protein [Aquamicrobium sp. LC103]
MTLDEAVRRAVSWHPSINEAIGRLNQRGEQINVAKSGYYPRVRGGVNSGYDSTDQDGWRPRFNLGASQMIYDFGKVSSSVEAAEAGQNISRAQLLLAVDQLIRETAAAVIEVQRNRALRGVAEDQVAGVLVISKLVKQRSDKGASTRSDEIQAEARVQAAQSTVLQIEAELNRWQSSLAHLVGGQGPFLVSANVPKWLRGACDTRTMDWSRVPAMMRAEWQRKEALAQLDESRAQVFPTLSLEAGVGYDLNQHRDASRDPEFTIGLNFTGNLYEGGAGAARRNAAAHALSAASAALDNARFEVRRSLSEASSQISGLSRLLGSLSARDGMMRETRDLYRQQYVELGTRTLLDLLNAEQELHAARFDTANTVHDLRRLGMECVFNSGLSREVFALKGMVVKGVALQP